MKLSGKHFTQTFFVFLFLSLAGASVLPTYAHGWTFHSFLQPNQLIDTIKGNSNKKADTARIDTSLKKVQHKKASNSIKTKVDYHAKDSILADINGKFLYLYKDAEVTYEGINIKADFIRIDQNTMTVYAKGLKDTSGVYTGRPFVTGHGNDLLADSIAYNFKSKKANVWSGVTQEGEGFIRGGKMKLDQNTNEGFLKGGVYTTCNDPDHMHFGIKISKAKVMENRIVTGPANLFIEDIPTPLVLPFGFFPKTSKRANGLIFPSVGEDDQKGFFLRDMGYYLGLGEYMDMRLLGTIYSNGSYDLKTQSSYLVRYRFSGNYSFSYSNARFGDEGTPTFSNTKDFRVLWSHSQTKQGTGSNFSASVNFGTAKYYQNTGNFMPLPNRFNNTIGSSIAYSKTWQGTPFNLTSSLTTSQQLNNGDIQISAPNLNFSVARITPFDSPNRIGPQRWYHKLGLNYNLQFNNSISSNDSVLFKQPLADQLKTLVTHSTSLQTNFNVLKYINISPSIPYTENWYFRTVNQTVDPVTNRPITTYNTEFKSIRDYSVGVSASTTLYGISQFKRGGVKAIRHTMRPSIGYSYKPDFTDPRFGYYKTYVDTAGRVINYPVVEGSVPGGKANALNFSLGNNLEMKVRSKKDTINGEKKISLLNDLSFSSSYNFAAPEFKLAPISMSGFTNLFKKINLNFGALFNPYATDSLGREIDKYSIAEGGPLVRLTSANVGLSASFSAADSKTTSHITQQQRDALSLIDPNPNDFIDFNIPWTLSVNYSFAYSNTYSGGKGRISTITQTLGINGDFSLTPKWKINGMTGWDFNNNEISPTSLGIVRDLHCWDLSIYWVPFGPYKQYSIDLRVKSTILQDLKLSKRRPYYYDDKY